MIRFVLLCSLLVFVAEPAAAMPAIGVAISAAFASVGVAVTAAAVNAFLIRTLISVGLSLLSQALNKPKSPAASGVKIDGTTAGEDTPMRFVVGRRMVGGHLEYHNSYGQIGKTPNAYYVMVFSVSDVPGVALRRVRINDEFVTLGAEVPGLGFPIVEKRDGDGSDHGYIKFYDGTQTTADPHLVDKFASDPDQPWTSNHILSGVAYVVLTMRYNREIWQGPPSVRFELDGIPLYDPRLDSTVGGSGAHRWDDPSTWSTTENLAVIAYNLMRGIPLPGGNIYGGEVAAADLPLANAVAGMNVCDVNLSSFVGGVVRSRKQYAGGLEISVDEEPAIYIEELLKAGLGQVSELGGVFRTRWGAPDEAVMAITDEDISVSNPQEFDPFPGLEATFNAIRITHPNVDTAWEPAQTPALYNAAWEAEDGNRRLPIQIDVAACFDHAQAQQLQAAYIKDERRFRQHQIVLPPEAQILEPLDTIAWTSQRNGYSNKLFEVVSTRYMPKTMMVALTLRERDPSDYDWDTELELPSAPNFLPTPRAPRAIADADWSLTGTSVQDASGVARRPALLFQWDAEVVEDAPQIEYEIQLNATSAPMNFGVVSARIGSFIVVEGVLPATVYRARIRPFLNAPSEWSSWLTATTPDVRLSDLDVFIKELFENAGLSAPEILSALPEFGNFAGRLVFLTTDNKLYRHTGSPSGAGGFTAAVPAVDVIGQLTNEQIAEIAAAKIAGQLTNEQIASINAAKLTGQVVADQIANAAITTAKFASGIRPIEIVSSLPTTGNFAGRTVFLTTDGKQYRHTGSPTGSAGFTASVASGDISGQVQAAQIAALEAAKIAGQITGTQISDNAITTPKIAAGAVTAVKISAGAVEAATIAAGAVQADKIAANAVTADKVAANAITAGKIAADAVTAGIIAAGAVSADEIAAGSITASKVAIGDFTNLVLNSQLDDFDGWIVSPEITGPINGISDMVSRRVAVIPVTITADRYIAWDAAAQGGKTYFMSVEARGSGTAPVLFTLRFIAQWFDRSGATILSDAVNRSLTTDGAVIETWSATAPAGAVSARFYFGRLNTASETGTSYIGSPVVRIMSDGELIVDGAITADKITSNAVTAEKIAAGSVAADKIASNAVTAVKISAGAVEAAKIAAGAVVADKIATNAITAVKIAAGTISGDKIAGNTITGNNIVANTITGGLLATAGIITSAAQINDAVITNAKIGDLQVDSAKIADLTVGTTKITGNAVSDTASGFVASAGFGGWTVISTIYFNGNADSPVVLGCTGYYTIDDGGVGNGAGEVRLIYNGTILFSRGFFDTYLRVVSAASGSNYLEVQARVVTGNSGTCTEVSTFALQLKR
ncbi:phage tail protein [Acidiphilium sp.]|uniref:phage tail protein n=1 Tax=Acidiphilium sp. TaxID=527 RepID=UPI00258F2F43|nr:phage tail protein [Acidiphilium sp.]